MQGDLISRSALIEQLKNTVCTSEYDEFLLKKVATEIVKNEPTAYSVEVVVSKMEKEKEKSFYDSNSIIGEKNVWAKAIEYVRNGGKE